MYNICLIYPEVLEFARFRNKRKEFPPFGVLYLASILKIKKHKVDLLKFTNPPQKMDLTKYDIVGISIPSSATYNFVLNCYRNIKIRSDSKIIVGGLHPTLFPEMTLADFSPHHLIINDAEGVIHDVVIGKYHNENIINGNLHPVELDEMPIPARDLLPDEDVFLDNRLANTNLKMTHIMFSRGCQNACYFCANRYKDVRYRSGENVVQELRYLIENNGIEGFAAVDDSSTTDSNSMSDICMKIAPLKLKWSALSRVDHFNINLFKAMKDAGCIEVKFGLESGSERMLTRMNKQITINQIHDAVIGAHHVGLKVKVFVVHGFPGECRETTNDTICILKELHGYIDRINLFRFVPLPGSSVYKYHDHFGIHNTHESSSWDGDWSKFRIYNNNTHWWGDKHDFIELTESFHKLERYIHETFGEY